MANNVVMHAWRMAREGHNMADIREMIDTRFAGAPGYITIEAERRAKQTHPKGPPLQRRERRRIKGNSFPSRGERRNDFHGRKNVGNTRPDERERTGKFLYHPTAPQAEDRRRARR